VAIIQPPEVKEGDDPSWLTNVATWHGIGWEQVSCRGRIEYMSEYKQGDIFFTVDTETAWGPTDELWQAVIAKYEGISFVYIAEEPGMGVFINTDTEGIFFTEKFMINIFGDAPLPDGWYEGKDKPTHVDIHEYFEDFDEVKEFCAEFTGKEFCTIEELQNYFHEVFDEKSDLIGGVYEFTAA